MVAPAAGSSEVSSASSPCSSLENDATKVPEPGSVETITALEHVEGGGLVVDARGRGVGPVGRRVETTRDEGGCAESDGAEEKR